MLKALWSEVACLHDGTKHGVSQCNLLLLVSTPDITAGAILWESLAVLCVLWANGRQGMPTGQENNP